MIWIWIVIIILVLVFLVFTLLKPVLQSQGEYMKARFLSLAEKDFLKALDSSIGSKYRVFAKVRLADIITPAAGNKSSWQTRFNKINAKHIDFLLCGMTDGEPVCAIELDDRTHSANSQGRKDTFKNHALQSAGIPIARFPVSRTYLNAEIAASIESATSRSPVPTTRQSPVCPKCGKQMVERKAQTGPNAGHSFWGCSGYPACKGIVNV